MVRPKQALLLLLELRHGQIFFLVYLAIVSIEISLCL